MRLMIFVLAATLCVTVLCAAQVEVTPFASAYLSSGGGVGVTEEFTPDGIISVSSSATPRATPIGGVQIAAWLGHQVAVEVGLAYSPNVSIATQLTSTWPDGGPFATCNFPQTCTSRSESSAPLTVGSARLLVTLSPPIVGHAVVYVIAGVGVVSYGPGWYGAVPAYALGNAAHGTEWGPTLGLGVRLPLTATLAPRVEVEDLAPNYWGGGPVLSVGLSMCASKCAASGPAR